MLQRSVADFVPVIEAARGREIPVYRQLYNGFRAAIVEGRLRPGQRVASTRLLAVELGISRISVLSAYEQLLSEGYFETFSGAGTCVAQSIPDELLQPLPTHGQPRGSSAPPAGQRRMSQRARVWANMSPQAWADSLGAFRVSLPALDRFPLATWSKLVAKHARTPARGVMAYGNPLGQLPFRQAVAEYLRASRAVRCDPSQILITTGSQQALQLCAQVLLNVGDAVAMEEPGYPGARAAFQAVGAKVVPITLDRDGLDVALLARKGPEARAVYVTPSHQYPMGMAMSAARRMLLLNWAARRNAWIIEDDYDSEYRFNGRPIASLQGMDSNERVIYVGTFSKVMFPALRVGYLVVPPDLLSAFSVARATADDFSSTLYQVVLTEFMTGGHFIRHIRRMRKLYMERRHLLIQALENQMQEVLEVRGDEAGMHLVAMLPPGIDDVSVAAGCARAGIAAMPLSCCFILPPARGGLVLGYGGTHRHQIRAGIKSLKRVYQSLPDGGPPPALRVVT